MVFFVRDILGQVFEFTPQAVTQLWREAEGHGFKYMGAKAPEPMAEEAADAGRTA